MNAEKMDVSKYTAFLEHPVYQNDCATSSSKNQIFMQEGNV